MATEVHVIPIWAVCREPECPRPAAWVMVTTEWHQFLCVQHAREFYGDETIDKAISLAESDGKEPRAPG